MHRIREKGTPVQRRDLTRRKFQIGDQGNNQIMIRVEESEKRWRAAVLQDTISIAVADFALFFTWCVGWGIGKNFKVTPLGNPSL